jgi:hypothetical protein
MKLDQELEQFLASAARPLRPQASPCSPRSSHSGLVAGGVSRLYGDLGGEGMPLRRE